GRTARPRHQVATAVRAGGHRHAADGDQQGAEGAAAAGGVGLRRPRLVAPGPGPGLPATERRRPGLSALGARDPRRTSALVVPPPYDVHNFLRLLGIDLDEQALTARLTVRHD